MYDQLLAVIPPFYKNLIPKNLISLMTNSNLIHMFPTYVELDMLHKEQLWQCVPLVPYLDIKEIENYTSKIKLDEGELKRLRIFE